MNKGKNFHNFVLLAVFNTIISIIASSPLIHYWDAPVIIEFLVFLSHFFMLNLAIAIILYLLCILSGKRIAIILNTLIFTVAQVLLLIDIKIYQIFHFHFNSLVWNVITVEGISDSLTLGKGTLVILTGTILLIIFVEFLLNYFLFNRDLPVLKKFSYPMLYAGIALILFDKAMYAYSDIVNWKELTNNAKLYPLYQTFTIKRFASRYLGLNVNKEEKMEFTIQHTGLNYPKNLLKFDPVKDRGFNILIIAVEGLRFDMLDPEVMPEVWNFSQQSLVFRNHYSAGNASRFGIFGLLYGISGTYWHTFLAERVSPVLINTAIEKNYEFIILSSTKLTFPEFRKTAFVRIPEVITDTFNTQLTEERDRIITEKFIDFLNTRKQNRPFFAFMFFDSSHQPFHYPDEFEKFKPALRKDINYFKDIDRDKSHLIRNKYKNSIYYEDHLIGKIIQSLRNRQLLEKTIVVITGDHGEEFYENGFLGHTSAFDDYQTRVVFVLHHPDAKPGIRDQLTSHLDLVPTLMDSMGCISPYEDYSQGYSLLKPFTRDHILTSNWDTSAIIDNEYKIVFSTESYKVSSFEIRTRDGYKEVQDQNQILHQRIGLLKTTLQQLSEFYK